MFLSCQFRTNVQTTKHFALSLAIDRNCCVRFRRRLTYFFPPPLNLLVFLSSPSSFGSAFAFRLKVCHEVTVFVIVHKKTFIRYLLFISIVTPQKSSSSRRRIKMKLNATHKRASRIIIIIIIKTDKFHSFYTSSINFIDHFWVSMIMRCLSSLMRYNFFDWSFNYQRLELETKPENKMLQRMKESDKTRPGHWKALIIILFYFSLMLPFYITLYQFYLWYITFGMYPFTFSRPLLISHWNHCTHTIQNPVTYTHSFAQHH